jgi:hypothetical protein
LNGSSEIVTTFATGSYFTSTLSSDSLSELSENSILLRGGAFFLFFFSVYNAFLEAAAAFCVFLGACVKEEVPSFW